MPTTTHPTTPTPDGRPSGKLKTSNTPDDHGDWYVYDDAAQPGSRLYCTAQGRDADVAEARAVYLARAVNAHEALVALAVDVACHFGRDHVLGDSARAALALARGDDAKGCA